MASQIILVTGANQGLGYAAIELGSQRAPGATWLLAARDLTKGQAAAEKLRSEAGVTSAIEVVKLDVTDDDDIIAAVDLVTKTHGKLDVLINNAGQFIRPIDNSLQALRKAFNDNCNVNLTSAAVVTEAFMPLLQKAPAPKVVNVTSGLGSIHNALNTTMGRFPPYGAAKVGMNGMTAHQQAREKDRVEAEADGKVPKTGLSFVKWYIINPGVLKTAFNGFTPRGRDPKEGAEPIVRIALDNKNEYDHAKSWEWVDGQMCIVPW